MDRKPASFAQRLVGHLTVLLVMIALFCYAWWQWRNKDTYTGSLIGEAPPWSHEFVLVWFGVFLVIVLASFARMLWRYRQGEDREPGAD